MFKEVIEGLFSNRVFYIVIAATGLISIVVKFCLGNAYRRYICSAHDIATTDRKWIKLMRLRFEALYKLKIGVHNTEIFVKRFIIENRFMGILFSSWDRLGTFLSYLCIVVGMSGSMIAYAEGRNSETIVLCTLSGLWMFTTVRMIESIEDIKGKKQLLTAIMLDYFENMLKVRLDNENIETLVSLNVKPDADYNAAMGETAAETETEKKTIRTEVTAQAEMKTMRTEASAEADKNTVEVKKEADNYKNNHGKNKEEVLKRLNKQLEKKRIKEMKVKQKEEKRKEKRVLRAEKRDHKEQKKSMLREAAREKREFRKQNRRNIKQEANKALHDKEEAKRLVMEAREIRAESKPVSKRNIKEENLIEDVLREFLA